jgi:hypothetical protein
MGIELSARTVGQVGNQTGTRGGRAASRRASARGRGDETGGRCLVALAVLAGRVVSNRLHHSCPWDPARRSSSTPPDVISGIIRYHFPIARCFVALCNVNEWIFFHIIYPAYQS